MPLPTILQHGNLKDPEGRAKRQKYFDSFERPVDYIVNRFRESWNKAGVKNRVFILKAKTASGKSTAFVGETYRALLHDTAEKQLMLLEPRRLNALNIPMQIMENYEELELGKNIGWSIQGNKIKPAHSASILAATIGTLTAQLRNWSDEEIIGKYRFIMLDETHERSIDIDIAMFMLKSLLLRNKDNPDFPFIVLMSATFEPEEYLRYFDIPQDNYIYVSGASYPIEEHWNITGPVRNLADEISATVHKIATDSGKDDPPEQADVLIFLPGANEIKACTAKLHKLNESLIKDGYGPISVLAIDGRAQKTESEDYLKTFKPPASYKEIAKIDGKEHKYTPARRVIASTNIAETGLTLENLKYVIDAGFNKEIEYNPHFNTTILTSKPAPKSRIMQRRGRVGRKFNGEFYPLYPKELFERFPDQQYPEVVTQDISESFLGILQDQIKSRKKAGRRGEFRLDELDMITPIPADFLHTCMARFYKLGFIGTNVENAIAAFDVELADPENDLDKCFNRVRNPSAKSVKKACFGITKLGALANKFSRFAIETIRMILAGFSWGASIMDLATIGAWLSQSPRDFALSRKKVPKWAKIYAESGIAKKFINSGSAEKDYAILRAFICDDFIDGIILYHALLHRAESSKGYKEMVQSIREFCEDVQLEETAVINFLLMRDELISQCMGNGLAVFINEAASLNNCKDEQFVDCITRLKYAIYDGYKVNTLINNGGQYNSMGNLLVSATLFPPEFEQANIGTPKELPRVLLYSKLDAKQDTMMFTISAERICMMTGFVNVDKDLGI